MKKFKFINAAFLTSLMMFAACSTNDGPSFSENYETVTFTFATDDYATATRAESSNQISQGKEIDVLVFAIYQQPESGNTVGTLLGSEDGKLYGDGSGIKNKNFKISTKGYYYMAFDGKPTSVSITLNKNYSYRILCWAQNSQCDAYDASKLEAVKINYAPTNNKNNNDESRDAFCAKQDFAGSADNVEVVLHRPLAQINVGTTGADYRANSKKINGEYYTHSKVTLKGQLANQLDVFTGKATTSDPVDTEYTFSYAAIPAYYQNEGKIPTSEDALLKLENEEFLQVELNGEDGFLNYKTQYPTVKEEGEGTDKTITYLTETFKYLSMNYVLPVGNAYTGEGSTIGFKVEFAKAETAETATTATSFSLTSIPVKSTWRTNILGGLAWIKDPDPKNQDPDYPDPDPENPKPTPTPPPGPDDPSSLFGSVTLNIIICPDYFGDKNKTDGTGSGQFTDNDNKKEQDNSHNTNSGSSNSGGTGE